MAKRNLFPILLVLVLLILLTTKSIPSAASTSHVQNEVQAREFAPEPSPAIHREEEPGSSPDQPTSTIRSGGGGLYLIK
jgi:hypothetical protein